MDKDAARKGVVSCANRLYMEPTLAERQLIYRELVGYLQSFSQAEREQLVIEYKRVVDRRLDEVHRDVRILLDLVRLKKVRGEGFEGVERLTDHLELGLGERANSFWGAHWFSVLLERASDDIDSPLSRHAPVKKSSR